MNTITVEMKDEFTGKQVIREIDISNFAVTNALHSVEKQREVLLEWIATRAEPQHDTFLQLVSWYVK